MTLTGQILFALAWCLGVASWILAVVYQFRAARAARPEAPWYIRLNAIYLLLQPDLWTPESRLCWRKHFLCVLAFLACVGAGFGIAYVFDPQSRP